MKRGEKFDSPWSAGSVLLHHFFIGTSKTDWSWSAPKSEKTPLETKVNQLFQPGRKEGETCCQAELNIEFKN